MVGRETDVWEDPSIQPCPRHGLVCIWQRGELAILGMTKVSSDQGWSLDLACIVWLVLRPAVRIVLLTSDRGTAWVEPKVWLEVRGCSSVLLGYMACGSGSDFHVELAGGLQRGVFPVARARGGEPRFFSHLVAPPFIHKNSHATVRPKGHLTGPSRLQSALSSVGAAQGTGEALGRRGLCLS